MEFCIFAKVKHYARTLFYRQQTEDTNTHTHTQRANIPYARELSAALQFRTFRSYFITENPRGPRAKGRAGDFEIEPKRMALNYHNERVN